MYRCERGDKADIGTDLSNDVETERTEGGSEGLGLVED